MKLSNLDMFNQSMSESKVDNTSEYSFTKNTMRSLLDGYLKEGGYEYKADLEYKLGFCNINIEVPKQRFSINGVIYLPLFTSDKQFVSYAVFMDSLKIIKRL